MAALAESIAADETCHDTREMRRALLPEAMTVLTDKQAIALWLEFGTDLSQREAAAYMGVPQSVFHESIYGKDGIGGAIRKLRKYFAAHPIV
jgi:DNA-directed RNA polymerase specialized sigma24 family protein